MANKSNFVAATGTYYVMAYLSREGIHASCTFGNAPSVDIIASSELIHDYIQVDLAVVWSTISNNVTPLLIELEIIYETLLGEERSNTTN